jgi:RimJ/RimL family protein N-acetyltransferase
VDEPNAQSRRLLARLGFQAVGVGEGPKHPLRAYSLILPKRRLDSTGSGG